MSLIDKKQEKALVKFFQANIQPLATEQNIREGFPKANVEEESYYVCRDWKPLTRQDFEISLSDRQKITTSLDKFWEKSPLLGFGKKIAQLTKKFPNIQEKSDVSSSVYEMF
jgi:hypothetical protein